MSESESNPPRVIDLGTLQVPNAYELLVERSQAIDAYANVEQSLSSLFAHLLGAHQAKAAIVFFRLNAHSRNAILEALLKQQFGDTYANYWNGIPGTANKKGLFSLLRALDQRRNEIVHFLVATNIGDGTDGGVLVENRLVPPNIWGFSDKTPSLKPPDLREFRAKASFVARSLNMFFLLASGQLKAVDEASERTWRDICQQPCTYPPPDSHPLSPTRAAL